MEYLACSETLHRVGEIAQTIQDEKWLSPKCLETSKTKDTKAVSMCLVNNCNFCIDVIFQYNCGNWDNFCHFIPIIRNDSCKNLNILTKALTLIFNGCIDSVWKMGVEGAGLLPWVGGPPDACFGFYLREAFQSLFLCWKGALISQPTNRVLKMCSLCGTTCTRRQHTWFLFSEWHLVIVMGKFLPELKTFIVNSIVCM